MRAWPLLAAMLLAACGGETESEPPYPTSGCPPSHENVDGRRLGQCSSAMTAPVGRLGRRSRASPARTAPRSRANATRRGPIGLDQRTRRSPPSSNLPFNEGRKGDVRKPRQRKTLGSSTSESGSTGSQTGPGVPRQRASAKIWSARRGFDRALASRREAMLQWWTRLRPRLALRASVVQLPCPNECAIATIRAARAKPAVNVRCQSVRASTSLSGIRYRVEPLPKRGTTGALR